MKANVTIICLLIALLPTAIYAQQKAALIIGNNDYSGNSLFKPLNNCERDADSIAHALQDLGFITTVRKNLTRRETEEAIRTFKLLEKDVALIYYSGHGIQDRGRNYLIPVDCEYTLEDRNYLDEYSYNMQGILDYYNTPARNDKVNILIVDACRNTTFVERAAKAATADLSGLSVYDNTFIAFSTNSGNVSSDNMGKLNGLFTQELLKHIRESIPLNEIMRKTKNSVVQLSNRAQVPGATDKLSVPFYFTAPAAGQGPVIYKVPVTAAALTGSTRSGSSMLSNKILVMPRIISGATANDMMNKPGIEPVIHHIESILTDANVSPAHYDFSTNANALDEKTGIVKKSGAERFLEVFITSHVDDDGANAVTVTIRGTTREGRTYLNKRFKSRYMFVTDVETLAIDALRGKNEELLKEITKPL